jgi:phosphatidylethanolamine/phosphatidyl-N-methylethanolamine N-methyltransferase
MSGDAGPVNGTMVNTVFSYWRFLLAGLMNQSQMGAVVPSQRFLIDCMISPVPRDYCGQILELGAGNGALTVRLAARCPQARIIACEINPVLARDLRTRMDAAQLGRRVEVVSDSAEHFLSHLRHRGARGLDFVISGIPLAHLTREQVFTLAGSIHRGLAPGGLYIQFQHSLIDRKKIKATFARLRTVPVFLNFPPAVVYYARK